MHICSLFKVHILFTKNRLDMDGNCDCLVAHIFYEPRFIASISMLNYISEVV